MAHEDHSGDEADLQPQRMMNWSKIGEVLRAMLNDEITGAFLLKVTDSNVLSLATSDSVEQKISKKVIAALVLQIWVSIQDAAVHGVGAEDLNSLVVDCEQGCVCISWIAHPFVIATLGSPKCDRRLILQKTELVSSKLQSFLVSIFDEPDENFTN